MSVAEKPLTEPTPRSPEQHLAKSSLLGAAYVLFSLWLVFSGWPSFWTEILKVQEHVNEFLSGALLLLVSSGVILGLFLLGHRLEQHNPPHGHRAGAFTICVMLFFITLVTGFLGGRMTELGGVGAAITVGILLALLYFSWRVLLKPGFCQWLRSFEDQGWFHALPYKPNQGLKVRRGTIVGLLTLGLCGIYTLITHNVLGEDRHGPNNWEFVVPFLASEDGTIEYVVPLMYKVHLILPVLMAVGLIWLSWRTVNWPAFGDFLIATEAEINKVSWSTRKRLVQDTIVVLVTVAVLTAFLFFVDILWIKVLGNPFVRVLQVDIKAEQAKQQEKTQW